MMEMFYRLHQDKGLTIVLVTHQMDDVANYADHMVILEKGTVVKEGSPRVIFSRRRLVKIEAIRCTGCCFIWPPVKREIRAYQRIGCI